MGGGLLCVDVHVDVVYSGMYMNKIDDVLSEYFEVSDADVYYTFKGIKCGGMSKNNPLYGKTVKLNELYRHMLEDVRIFLERDIIIYSKNNTNNRQKLNIIGIMKSITYKKYGVTIEKVHREVKKSNNNLHTDDLYEDLIEVYGIYAIDWMKLYNNIPLFYCKNDDVILYIANKILSDKIYEYFKKNLGLKVTGVIRENRKKYDTQWTKVRLEWDSGERYIPIGELMRNKKDWYSNATRNKKLNRGNIQEFDEFLNLNSEDEVFPEFCPIFPNVAMNYTSIDFSNNMTRQKGYSKMLDDNKKIWSFASLDRIDSNSGYRYDNVQIICDFANSLKGSGNENQIIKLGEFLKNKKSSIKFEYGLGI